MSMEILHFRGPNAKSEYSSR